MDISFECELNVGQLLWKLDQAVADHRAMSRATTNLAGNSLYECVIYVPRTDIIYVVV